MKAQSTNTLIETTDIIRIAAGVAAILAIPVLGNLFVEGWNWGPEDFIVMGALLFGTGLALHFATKMIAHPTHRAMACLAIVFALFLIWIELAVDAVSQLLTFILG